MSLLQWDSFIFCDQNTSALCTSVYYMSYYILNNCNRPTFAVMWSCLVCGLTGTLILEPHRSLSIYCSVKMTSIDLLYMLLQRCMVSELLCSAIFSKLRLLASFDPIPENPFHCLQILSIAVSVFHSMSLIILAAHYRPHLSGSQHGQYAP